MSPFVTCRLPARPDTLAPDGSEIRLLPVVAGGSMAHARLPPGGCSLAVRHRSVEELWFVFAGSGELWRRQDGREEVTSLAPGVAASIPLGTDFQFRASASTALEIVIVTIPSWPGADEALRVDDHWPVGEPG